MLERTPDAFVFAYSQERGIRVFPANSVVGLGETRSDIFQLYDRGIASFFQIYIECFVGDPRLDSTDIEALDALIGLPVEHVMKLSARTD